MKRIFGHSHTSSHDQCLKMHMEQVLRKPGGKDQGSDEHARLQDSATRGTDTRALAKVFKERKHYGWPRKASQDAREDGSEVTE